MARENLRMTSPKIIPDIVSSQRIHAMSPDKTVRDAARTMSEQRIGAVVIVQDDRLIGIFTERDLSSRVVAPGLDPDSVRLSDVMTRNPDTLGPDDTAMAALQKMRARGFRHLPVLMDGKVVGMVSVRDLYNAVQQQLESDIKERDAYIFGESYGVGS